MKVLSITEPYATLIKDKKKRIETRSFKTTYRGCLYIHASKTKIAKEVLRHKELMNLVDSNSFHFGSIIAKCELVDCIYMTKEFVLDIKKNHPQEYLCGDYKAGRYAWILDHIEPLKVPVKAKGQLGLWNYYDEEAIMFLMDAISYGWVDQKGNKHIEDMDLFANAYKLQSPKEIIQSRLGVCWDQVELERYYFKNTAFPFATYFLVYDDHDQCPTHTFLVYEKEHKVYWFEHAWEKYRGIHEYASYEDLIEDVKEKFIGDLDTYQKGNLFLYCYQKPKYGLSTEDFYKYCTSSKQIHL